MAPGRGASGWLLLGFALVQGLVLQARALSVGGFRLDFDFLGGEGELSPQQ